MWVFFFYKYSKFWSVLLDIKVDLKPLFSEECHPKAKYDKNLSLEKFISNKKIELIFFQVDTIFNFIQWDD